MRGNAAHGAYMRGNQIGSGIYAGQFAGVCGKIRRSFAAGRAILPFFARLFARGHPPRALGAPPQVKIFLTVLCIINKKFANSLLLFSIKVFTFAARRDRIK